MRRFGLGRPTEFTFKLCPAALRRQSLNQLLADMRQFATSKAEYRTPRLTQMAVIVQTPHWL
jgi:hypothetical protein